MTNARALTALSAMALVAVACAEQGTVVVNASLPFAVENWNRTLSIPQFSKPLFNLDSIDVAFTGNSKGTVKIENRDPIARAYTAKVCSLLELKNAAGTANILSVHPKCSDTAGTLARYDGVVDFGGTSGVTFVADAATATVVGTVTGADLAPFVGAGNLDLPVSGTVTSTLTVAGNNTREVQSLSSVDVQFTYHYSFERGSLGDKVFLDANGNGLQDPGELGKGGVTVTLTDADGNVSTTTTAADGSYLFDNLVPGAYSVKFTAPDGTAFTTADAGDDSLDSDASADGSTPKVTVHSGEKVTSVDAGLVGLQSLGDRVWLDLNGNGVQDPGEPGKAGVSVDLYDASNVKIGSVVTDASGKYLFSGLLPGAYAVQFAAPAGAGFTGAGLGGDATLDSDAATNGRALVTLAAGDKRTDIDAGLVGLQSLGDRVWLDSNGNGIQDGGEPGIAGVKVHLLDATGAEIDAKLTDANGLYTFSALFPGSYGVVFDPIGGYSRSAPGAGGDRSLDSDADADGKTGLVSLAAGDNRTDIDAGYKGALMLGDRVFFDANANGIQDPTEKGIKGVKVTLRDAAGNVVGAPQTTGDDGGYLFTDLLPGNYSVKFDKPVGYTFSGAHVGMDPTLDSDVDGAGVTDVIALTADNLNVDAGLYGTLSLGDRVWKDLDKDGLQDSCEPGVPGVKVHLLDASGAEIATTTTGANGVYAFSNLAPGDYTVVFDAPTGYGFTKQFADSRYKQYDSNVDVATGRATVTLAANDVTIDAGLIGALKIGDTVWLDSDGDKTFDLDQGEKGIAGVRVYMLGDLNGDGRADVSASTVTDKDGHYQFLGLTPGLYQVTLNANDLPRNVVQTTKYGTNATYVGLGYLTAAGDNLDFDFGYKPTTPSNGCGHKWWCGNTGGWSWDCMWIGKKCFSKSAICAWLKRDDCGDKSICLFQRLCAAKLNVGNGCNEGKVYTCGKTCLSLKDAIKCADAWLTTHPVGCNVSGSSRDWSSICDVFAILDAHCNGR